MHDRKRLIPASLLSVSRFRDDLQAFLGLSVDQLQRLSELAEQPAGFAAEQSIKFAAETSISPQEARRALTVAQYLYERCRERQISVDDAVTELLDAARTLDLEESPEKPAVLRDLLRARDEYESGPHARREAVGTVAHFERIDGVWDIRPVFHRETHEVVARVPALLINVAWHDMSGTTHEAVFQLDDEGWAELKDEVERLDRYRRALQAELGDR